MTAATIDLDALDSLFDNQKKLDEIFNSIFDEDLDLSSPVSFNNRTPKSSDSKTSQNFHSNEDWSLNTEDKIIAQKKQSITYLVIPVMVEIAAIYYGIMYFI